MVEFQQTNGTFEDIFIADAITSAYPYSIPIGCILSNFRQSDTFTHGFISRCSTLFQLNGLGQ